MLTYNEYKSALDSYFTNEGIDGNDLYQLRNYREDIITLSNSFEKRYGFRLMDIEIYAMWIWHCESRDSGFLAVHDADRDIDFFIDFVNNYKNKG